MESLSGIFVKPFADMAAAPDFLLQVIWEGLVSGVLYALIALGFVLIYKSSRIFNFAQGIMVVSLRSRLSACTSVACRRSWRCR